MTSLTDLVLLALAILSASTGTTWFALLSGHPVLRACWRMQITVVLQAPLMLYEYSRMDGPTRQRWWSSLWMYHIPTGAVLGLHFASVSACVSSTSLSHAILLVNTAPLFIVTAAIVVFFLSQALANAGWVPGRSFSALDPGGVPTRSATLPPDGQAQAVKPNTETWTGWLAPEKCLPPTALESVGACIAFAGVFGLILGADADKDEARVTLAGDLVGLVASACLARYFFVGSSVRKWCPLFSWLCPLHISASITTAAYALLLVPGTTLYTVESSSTAVLSWVHGGNTLMYAGGASVFAGMLGHGLSNYVLPRVGTLTVSVGMLLQPISGTVIGYLAGVQGRPGLAALLAAPIILYGAYMVTVGGREKGLTFAKVFMCRLRQVAPVQAPTLTTKNTDSVECSRKTLMGAETGAALVTVDTDPSEWSPTGSFGHVPRLLPAIIAVPHA